jgi:hypothetical protein
MFAGLFSSASIALIRQAFSASSGDPAGRTGVGLARVSTNPGDGQEVMMFPGIVPNLDQAQTFLATIEIDPLAMKILAVISILALLTITGAAYTDQLLTGDQETAQRAN